MPLASSRSASQKRSEQVMAEQKKEKDLEKRAHRHTSSYSASSHANSRRLSLSTPFATTDSFATTIATTAAATNLTGSLPSTCASSTAVNAAKARRCRRASFSSSQLQRSDSCSSLLLDEEEKINGNHSLFSPSSPNTNTTKQSNEECLDSPPAQGTTPYWKVAAERGGATTPPETRSATKKRQNSRHPLPPLLPLLSASNHHNTTAFDDADDSEAVDMNSNNQEAVAIRKGVLLFSPPNQQENARREKEDLDVQHQEWDSRVQQARQNGQLLLFSPTTHRLLTPFPDPTEAHVAPPESQSTTTTNDAVTCDSNSPSTSASSSTLQETEPLRVSSGISSHTTNEDVTILIKKVLDQVQHNQEGMAQYKESAHAFAAEFRTSIQAQLEKQNESLAHELKTVTDQWRKDKEAYLVQVTRLEAQYTAAQQRVSETVPALQQQVHTLSEDKSQQLAQLLALQNQLKDKSQQLKTKQQQIQAWKQEHQTEIKALQSNHQLLEQAKVQLKTQVDELELLLQQQSKQITESELIIQRLQDDLKEANHQLSKTMESLRSEEAALSEVQKVVTGHQNTIQQLQDEVDQLQDQIQHLTSMNKSSNQQQEQHQQKRDQQLQDTIQQLSAKNAQIGDLFRQLGVKELELQNKSKELDKVQSELAKVKESFQSQTQQLKDSLTEALAQLSESDQVKMQFENRVKSLELLLNQEEDRSKERAEQLKLLQEQLDATHGGLLRMQSENHKDQSTTQGQVMELRAKLQQAEKQLHDRSSQHRQQVSAFEKEKQNLQQSLKEFKNERDEARTNMLGYNEREAQLYRRLQESDRLRRDLHARVMQLTGNIRVYIRVRPPLAGEFDVNCANQPSTRTLMGNIHNVNSKKRTRISENVPSLFSYPGIFDRENKSSRSSTLSGVSKDDVGKNVIEVSEPLKDRGGLQPRHKSWKFAFDNVFSPLHGQDDVWEATQPLVQSAIDGYNVTIFAYGQTGSGKTYTMLGDDTNPGIISRAVSMLFRAKREIEELSCGASNIETAVELLEIYNERVRDLLDPESDVNRIEKSLTVNSKEVVGNLIIPTKSEEEVMELVGLAQDRRCVKSTLSNSESSRSHLLFTIHYNVIMKDGSRRTGKLNICDLAGSERLSKSGANFVGGALLDETKNINKSLSVLSNVIEKLQAGEKIIPFRESKLTFMLQNSLCGNSKTLAIVCCNPHASHFHESLCSLRFAEKVSKVELKAVNSFTC